MDEEKKEEKPQEQKKEQEAKVECQKCAEYLNGWKRALADYDNLRKDLAKEKALLRAQTREDLLRALLPVINNFDEAVRHAPSDQWAQGVRHVYAQMEDALKQLGAEPFGKEGDAFDPTLHEPITQKSNPEKPDQTLLEIHQRGWKLYDKIIQPAKATINTYAKNLGN